MPGDTLTAGGVCFVRLPRLRLVLCIGQSNMAGRGPMDAGAADTLRGVYLFNDSARFERAAEPMNRYSTVRKELGMQRIGPVGSFAARYAEVTGAPVGVVVNARGGSSIDEWLPGSETDYLAKAVERIRAAGDWGDFAAVLWHQGEADSAHPERYGAKLRRLVAILRTELGNPSLPVVFGEIAHWNWTNRAEGTVPFNTMLRSLRQLEEEDPLLHVVYDEAAREIRVQLMGEVQLEVLRSLLAERFGLEVSFGPGGILYKETITEPMEGVGHYEPLRHYAEVHLLLEPLPRGSGMQFAADCREEVLDKNWQRLVLTHLEEKQHLGVLTGAPLTDVKITLLAGKAHLKHTEGGDFRQATYRAVRQGLMLAKSQLLEPWYAFRLEVPVENIGRAMSDIQRMEGSFDPPESGAETATLTGFAPVSTMRSYPMEVVSYTRGRGHLSLTLDGYRPCHNAQEVIAETGYQPEHDLDNPADSVFCAHGAGFVVPWSEVRSHMHVESGWGKAKPARPEVQAAPQRRAMAYRATLEEDAELLKIFERTYGPIKRDPLAAFRPVQKTERPDFAAEQWEIAPEYLLVDGYNIIFAWDELNALAKESLDAARRKLMDILCNYQGYQKCVLILVFDAYRVPGSPGAIEQYHNIHVVYTKEAETADMFIERVTHEIGKSRRVRVATSDGMEQVIILATAHCACPPGCSTRKCRTWKSRSVPLCRDRRKSYPEKIPLL